MLNIGRKQKLVVVKKVEFGIYLGRPGKQARRNVFFCRSNRCRKEQKREMSWKYFCTAIPAINLIATTREPKLVLGELAVLNVAATGKIGAFLDWGLEKDLFLPFKQQTRRLHPGDEGSGFPLHRQERPSLRNDEGLPFLKTNSPYVVGDIVKGRIYEISGNFGVFVAVDDRYSGLIPKREAQADYHVGQELECRVTEVKEDGKLSLSARGKAYEQIRNRCRERSFCDRGICRCPSI